MGYISFLLFLLSALFLRSNIVVLSPLDWSLCTVTWCPPGVGGGHIIYPHSSDGHRGGPSPCHHEQYCYGRPFVGLGGSVLMI